MKIEMTDGPAARTSAWAIALALSFCCAMATASQVYRWVDADGTVHYSQTPPPSQGSDSVETLQGAPSAQTPSTAADINARCRFIK